MKFAAIYHKASDNLGDDIQTYAALRFLPRADVFVDREALDTFAPDDGQMVAAVMNGWYLHKKYHWPPAAGLHPLCTGMHFEKADNWGLGTAFLDGPGGEWLAAHGPVGCADEASLHALRSRGIESFLSGCLTLTLPRQSRAYGGPAYICAVDISPEAVAEIGHQVAARDFTVVETTHTLPARHAALPVPDRMAKVAEQLALYRNAHCVVTSRLHCALPCLALGVPVLLLAEPTTENNATALPANPSGGLAHTEDMRLFGLGMGDYSVITPPENPRAFEPLRDALNKAVTAFVAACRDAEHLVPPPDPARQAELAAWRAGLMQQAAEASFDTINALRAENYAVYRDRLDSEARTGTALMRAENRREEIIIQFDYLWRENMRIRDVERQASAHLDAIAKSRSYRFFRTMQAGLREFKSLNPVRWAKYIAAVFARLAGRKGAIHRYRLLDPLLQVQRYLSHQGSMGIPGYDLATRYCYVPMDDDTWKRTADLLRIVRKRRKVMWILAPMFRDSVLTDGYFRRIKAIDDLLGDDVQRIYLSQLYLADKNIKVPIAIDFATDCRWEITYDRDDPVQLDMIKAMMLPGDTFYSHSVEQISAIATDGYHTGPLFVDMHGISPEEHVMHGSLPDAQRAGDQEEFVAATAHRVIVVTEAMGEHYKQKYPDFRPGIITMPILETALDVLGKPLAERGLEDGRPVVVYAGALQKWQQIDVMQAAMSQQPDAFSYRIFTSKPADFMAMWPVGAPRPEHLLVGTRSVDDLKAEYNQCHYGFALREDTAVNRVSCPTKLVEYIEFGIVPILQSTRIGDFVRFGMQYVALEDFLAGNLPDEATRRKMAEDNRQVLLKINELFKSGRAALLAALDLKHDGRAGA
ncbi:MAG: hypothetical protein GXY32_09040 [Ruminococcaceae bacterium]|nr:hypothetical protein [Oscillospiraceae bacterium]